MRLELFNGVVLPLPASLSPGTLVQIGLWGVILLALLYGLWEIARRRRTPLLGQAELISLPGGVLPPGEHHELNGRALTIGRAPEAALRLVGQSIAMRHAAVVPEGGLYWLKDLGTYTGVRLNGRRLEQSASLRDGDVVAVADQSFRFQQERKRPWEPNVWTGFLLLGAGVFFVLTQLIAWNAAGAARPLRESVLYWSAGLAVAGVVSTLLLRRRRLVVDPVLLPIALALPARSTCCSASAGTWMHAIRSFTTAPTVHAAFRSPARTTSPTCPCARAARARTLRARPACAWARCTS